MRPHFCFYRRRAIELLQQFSAVAHRPCLNAVCHLPQVVIGLIRHRISDNGPAETGVSAHEREQNKCRQIQMSRVPCPREGGDLTGDATPTQEAFAPTMKR